MSDNNEESNQNDYRPDPPGRTRHLHNDENGQNTPMNNESNENSDQSLLRDNRSDNNNNNNNNASSFAGGFSAIRGCLDDAATFEHVHESPDGKSGMSEGESESRHTPADSANMDAMLNSDDALEILGLVNSNSHNEENIGSSNSNSRSNYNIVNSVDAVDVVIHNVNSNEISNLESTSNILQGPSLSIEDDDEEIALNDYEIAAAAKVFEFADANGNVMMAGSASGIGAERTLYNKPSASGSTTPANVFDLSSIEPSSQPMYSAVSSMTHNRENDRLQSRLLVRHLTRAAILSEDYEENLADMSPALKRRLRDFRFAQRKRREMYGEQNPWGIIGLYDHLTGIRTDIEWAEDAAWRRENDQPYLSWQDFEDAKDTGFNQPFFTYFTMLVCTVCLVISIGLNGWKVEKLTINPMIGPSAEVLVQMGAKKTNLIVNDGEWFRIFTSMVRRRFCYAILSLHLLHLSQ